MSLLRVCDECGETTSKTVSLMTGYVYINDQHHGQSVDLCDKHYPKPRAWQPNDCKRVRFLWPGRKEK